MTDSNIFGRPLRWIMTWRHHQVSATADRTGISARGWAHVFGLWGHLWFIPLLPAIYALIMLWIGDLRPEHVAVSLAAAALGFGTKATRALLVLSLPGLLVAWGNDLFRYLRPVFVMPDRILGCSLQHAELTLFSVAPDQTLPDYFAIHHTAFFDVVAAIPYAIFWMVAVATVCWLFYADKRRLNHYLWALLLTQVIAFVFWLALPAAPPWYIRAHGCTIDASVLPNAAALLRVDHLLGIHFFQDFYSRAATTFGALPSMHCAYPMIGLLTAWRVATWRTRPLHLFYAGWMIAASVYLDHHWLIDGLLGWVVSAVAVMVVGAVLKDGFRVPGWPQRRVTHYAPDTATPYDAALEPTVAPAIRRTARAR